MVMERKPPSLFLALLVCLIAANYAVGDADFRKMDRAVRKLMSCAKIPALSLAAASLDDSAAYSKAYYNTGRSLTSSTSFCIGGGTQAFTAVLLAKLIDENENVTWDTPIQNILNQRVPVPGLYRREHLNLKDIFAMRSGVAGMDIVPVVKPYSREELVRNLIYAPVVAGFREKFVYNEVLFGLIEDIIEEIGGDSWHNLLRLHILQPLDMSDTVVIGGTDGADTANPSFTVNKVTQLVRIDSHSGLELVAPAAGLCTSANDMTKWFRFVLTGGMDNSNIQIIRKKVLEDTFKPVQSRGNGGDPEIQGYRMAASYFRDQNALGWIKGHYRGSPFLSQDGSLPGYQALSTIIPDRKIAVHVALSGDNAPRNFAAKTLLNIIVLDLLMDKRMSVTDTDVCARLSEMEKEHHAKNKKLSLQTSSYRGGRDLNDYTGYYRNYAFGDIRIRYNKTENENLLMEYGIATYILRPTHINDTFALDAEVNSPLWYTTHSDINKDRLFAEFGTHPQEPDQMETLTVSGFDRNVDPEFSKNPGEPEIEDYVRCSSCKTIFSLWCLVLCILTVSLR